jgi:hypothetical protein
MEIQAKMRYNEVVENQFKRINTTINDKTRPLGERLRELFRRDGLTIGALITAIGMTISTIVLSIVPASPPTPAQPSKKTFTDNVKQTLVKIANWFLDLAKKALVALPGALGGLVSFLFKKAGEAVLFFSEHLVIFFMALILMFLEFVWRKTLRK